MIALQSSNHNDVIVDCRPYIEWTRRHVIGSVHCLVTAIIKRRVQEGRLILDDYIRKHAYQSFITVIDTPDAFCKQHLIEPQHITLYSSLDEYLTTHPQAKLEFSTDFQKFVPYNIRLPSILKVYSFPSLIIPYLYLGDEADAHNFTFCSENSITSMINVTSTVPKPEFISDWLRIPILDSVDTLISPYFSETNEFLHSRIVSSTSVLVHCQMGISRSATIIIAYLMYSQRLMFKDAYDMVKSKRSIVAPNFGFLGQLIAYEITLGIR